MYLLLIFLFSPYSADVKAIGPFDSLQQCQAAKIQIQQQIPTRPEYSNASHNEACVLIRPVSKDNVNTEIRL